jgi:hypothetical protein
LKLASHLDPASVAYRVYAVNFASALLDLGMVWGWWRCLEKTPLSASAKKWGMALIVLPWFLIGDCVRPNQEHAATAIFWMSLGFFAADFPLLAGFFSIGVIAFKYNFALLSLGIYFSVFLQAILFRKGKRLARFLIGVALGVGIFGLADWKYYGRPWESAWMFLQFNVFTHLSSDRYGSQSPTVYLEFLWSHWKGVMLPVALPLLVGMIPGLMRGLLKFEPWFFALLFYGIGHFLVPHKEPRFIWGAEFLFVWAGFIGLASLISGSPELGSGLRLGKHSKPVATVFSLGVRAFLLVMAFMVFRGIWGESAKSSQSYLEVHRHLQENPNTCAVVSVRSPGSIHLPNEREKSDPAVDFDISSVDAAAVPHPSFGYFKDERGGTLEDKLSLNTVYWIGDRPNCEKLGSVLLFQPEDPDPYLSKKGCKYLASSVWSQIPPMQAVVHGPWYACPGAFVAEFFRNEIKHPLVYGFLKYEKLPPYGTTGASLIEDGNAHTPPVAGRAPDLGTL